MKPSWLPVDELSSSPQKKKVKRKKITPNTRGNSTFTLNLSHPTASSAVISRVGVKTRWCAGTLSSRFVLCNLFRLCKLLFLSVALIQTAVNATKCVFRYKQRRSARLFSSNLCFYVFSARCKASLYRFVVVNFN